MFYAVKLEELGENEYLVTCRDVPECIFKATSKKEAIEQSPSVLTTAMQMHYRRKRKSFPLPSLPEIGERLIYLPLKVQAKILFWNYLQAQEIKLADASRRLGLAQTQVQRMVDLNQDKGASLEAIEDAIVSLGGCFTLTAGGSPCLMPKALHS